MAQIFCTFGFKKNAREGILVSVEVDGEKISERSEGIKLISNPAHRRRECWWGGSFDVPDGSTIHLITLVGVRGAGQDTERTTDQWYTVDEEAPVHTATVSRVGYRTYPLLQGKMIPTSVTSAQDHVERELQEQLRDIEE